MPRSQFEREADIRARAAELSAANEPPKSVASRPVEGEQLPLMTLGQGFRADYNDYRLLVEAGAEGWKARVYHKPAKKWAWEENVETPEEGKEAAITTAVIDEQRAATPHDIDRARSEITWTPYGPGSTEMA